MAQDIVTTETKSMEAANGGQNPRETFTGRQLGDVQFAECNMIAEMLRREIEHSGTFKAKLTDYAYAFSRSEKYIDAHKGENYIRNIFSDRFGMTPKAMLDKQMAREETVLQDPHAQSQALHHARAVESHMKEGDSMPFYRASDKEAVAFAKITRISEKSAKKMISSSYEAETGKDFYQTMKAVEKEHYIPKVEAAKAAREAAKQENKQTQQQSQTA